MKSPRFPITQLTLVQGGVPHRMQRKLEQDVGSLMSLDNLRWLIEDWPFLSTSKIFHCAILFMLQEV
jgi:hypothetical protein